MSVFIENEIFEKADYSKVKLAKGEYDDCTFKNCLFLNVNVSETIFIDCEFVNCNFSNSYLKNTSFRSVIFKNCKLLGLQFNDCNPFLLSIGFEECHLNIVSFYKMKLKNTKFNKCKLQEVDFSETDLTNASFNNCDLIGSIFNATILEKADFRTSYNYSIDPEINRLKKAKFSLHGVVGLLGKYQIEIE